MPFKRGSSDAYSGIVATGSLARWVYKFHKERKGKAVLCERIQHSPVLDKAAKNTGRDLGGKLKRKDIKKLLARIIDEINASKDARISVLESDECYARFHSYQDLERDLTDPHSKFDELATRIERILSSRSYSEAAHV